MMEIFVRPIKLEDAPVLAELLHALSEDNTSPTNPLDYSMSIHINTLLIFFILGFFRSFSNSPFEISLLPVVNLENGNRLLCAICRTCTVFGDH